MVEGLITWSLRHRRIVLALGALLVAVGVHSTLHTPVDAIPDLSENQVTVHVEWPGRSPEDVEKSVTSLAASGLRGVPGVRVVRTMSSAGTSMVDVIFEDGVSREDARARVGERITLLAPQFPRDATPLLAPDATAVGQVFWYTVEGPEHDIGELRSIQDTFVRPHLQSVPGVAEVASAGGARRELHVEVDPERLLTHEVSVDEVVAAVARSSATLGGGVLEHGSAGLALTGRTAIESSEDVENAVVAERDGVPVLVRHLAHVQFGPGPRWGILEKDGREAVGGVVLMRHGANPREVIEGVRARLRDLSGGLPAGVSVVPFYDRTELIDRAIRTSTTTLLLEMGVACLAILLIMGHAGGALVVCLSMPLAVLFSLTLMRLFGIPSNIMSLAGIAISVGVLVDQAIVLTDNSMHHLRRKFGDSPATGDLAPVLEAPAREVGRPLFYSVLIMVLSFLPVFALQGMEGRMYTPLALTKTFALLGALLLTVTVLPALLPYVLRGRIRDESENWLVRSFIAVYRPVLAWLLPRPAVAAWVVLMLLLGASAFLGSTVLTGVLAAAAGVAAACFGRRTSRGIGLGLTAALAFLTTTATPLGTEFMPPLQEGDLVDMPVTVPGVSTAQVMDDLKARNALLRTFPEVEVVVGKAGRAETVTDPAPMEMVETLVNLLPREQWPRRHAEEGQVRWAAERALGAARAKGLFPDPLEDEAAFVEKIVSRASGRFDTEMREACRQQGPPRAEGHGDRAGRLAATGPGALARASVEALLLEAEARTMLAEPPTAEAAREIEKSCATAIGDSVRLRKKTQEDLVRELDALLQVPGWANIWTQPIVNRIDMMATGIRTQVGVKVFGPDIETIQGVSERVAAVLRTVPGAADIVVDQGMGRGYLEVVPDRARAAGYGVAVADIARSLDTAVAGQVAAVMRRSGEDIPVRVVYARDFRQDQRSLRRIPVPLQGGPASGTTGATGEDGPGAAPRHAHGAPQVATDVPNTDSHIAGGYVPLSSVANLCVTEGPAMIRGEDGFTCAYVQFNVRGRDLVGFVEEARDALRDRVQLPRGVRLEWGGQYEHHVRVRNRLLLVVPLVLLLLGAILYWTYRNWVDVILVLGAIPGALAGGLLLQAMWGAEFSVAIWIGYIACAGMAVESAMIMLVYLREAVERRGGMAAIQSGDELREAVLEGAVKRQRPKLLTEATTVLSLVPMLWATGAGAEVTSLMALPVLGGILLADEVIDLLLPVAFLHNRVRS